MSRRPGIGAGWIDRHCGDVYQDDTIHAAGFIRRPPAYYDYRTFRGDRSSLLNLRKFRAAALRADYNRSPKKYFEKRHPDRRAAAIKIRAAERSLKPGSKI